jgi:hypothetical protein
MPAPDSHNRTNFDYHRLADCELDGGMSAAEITEVLTLLFFPATRRRAERSKSTPKSAATSLMS